MSTGERLACLRRLASRPHGFNNLGMLPFLKGDILAVASVIAKDETLDPDTRRLARELADQARRIKA